MTQFWATNLKRDIFYRFHALRGNAAYDAQRHGTQSVPL